MTMLWEQLAFSQRLNHAAFPEIDQIIFKFTIKWLLTMTEIKQATQLILNVFCRMTKCQEIRNSEELHTKILKKNSIYKYDMKGKNSLIAI